MSDKPLVLVTGASGFIATHCILKLLERGYPVRGTLRSLDRGAQLKALFAQNGFPNARIAFVQATLDSDTGWAEAAQGCAYVLHVASPIATTLPRHEDELIVPARDGALRVLKAARDAGVKRVVMTSSMAAIVYGHDGVRGKTYSEADWTNVSSKETTPYIRSKAIAEKAAWDWLGAEGGGLELATINPGIVLGPALEADFGASLEAIRQVMAGAVPGAPNLCWPVVDVRDVAEMHVLAMETPAAAGERFVCANDLMSMREVAAILRAKYPERRKIPRRNLPSWLMRMLSMFNPAIRSVLVDLDSDRAADNSKARRILGWTPRSNEEAVIAGAESLVKFGVV